MDLSHFLLFLHGGNLFVTFIIERLRSLRCHRHSLMPVNATVGCRYLHCRGGYLFQGRAILVWQAVFLTGDWLVGGGGCLKGTKERDVQILLLREVEVDLGEVIETSSLHLEREPSSWRYRVLSVFLSLQLIIKECPSLCVELRERLLRKGPSNVNEVTLVRTLFWWNVLLTSPVTVWLVAWLCQKIYAEDRHLILQLVRGLLLLRWAWTGPQGGIHLELGDRRVSTDACRLAIPQQTRNVFQ